MANRLIKYKINRLYPGTTGSPPLPSSSSPGDGRSGGVDGHLLFNLIFPVQSISIIHSRFPRLIQGEDNKSIIKAIIIK